MKSLIDRPPSASSSEKHSGDGSETIGLAVSIWPDGFTIPYFVILRSILEKEFRDRGFLMGGFSGLLQPSFCVFIAAVKERKSALQALHKIAEVYNLVSAEIAYFDLTEGGFWRTVYPSDRAVPPFDRFLSAEVLAKARADMDSANRLREQIESYLKLKSENEARAKLIQEGLNPEG